MATRELQLAILGVLALIIIGGADYLYEVHRPGEEIIDVATVAMAAVLGYRAGRNGAG